MNKFSYRALGKYISPIFVLGAILLFGLVNASFVDASIIVTGPTTTTHPPCHYPDCHYIVYTTTTTICPSPLVDITVAPPSVPYNGSAVLHWTSSNANYCTASASSYNYQWSGNVSLNGDKSINNLTQTTTFAITCNSSCHNPVSNSTTVYVQSPITRYTCNTNTYQCYQTTSGAYTSYNNCVNACQAPTTKYTCNVNYQCVVDSNGQYTSLSTCQNNCITPIKYSCNTNTYQCYVNTNGAYSNLNDCTTNCQASVTRYACNYSTYQCYQTTSGAYTSWNTCEANCQAHSENFDFSLSTSGNITVTKLTSGSITRSNTITANLVNGTTQSVSFSQSGLPYGVSAYSLYSCYPTCSKTNTLTINSYASIGTFSITVTATGGGITRTTTYHLTIQDSYNDALSVSCYASPNPAEENETVTFRSNVSGGSGNYSYYWSGATHGSNSYSQESFNSDGNYTAYLTVHDSQNRSASTSCSVNVSGQYTNTPILNLWADKYTIAQGESTYLRWTSTNANYCTASNGWSGSKSTSGYESVSPNSDTTYSLTCYSSGGQITRSVTIYVTSITTNLNLTKLGRNLSAGERVYSKVIRVTEGDVIEFYLTVTAGNNKDLYNVDIKDIMPSILSYMPGTTKIDNIVQPDIITTTGLSLGTLYKGTSKTIVFQAISLSPGTYLTYTNTAEVTADNESKITDSASITYGLVAGAATIRTGPLDTLFISFVISLISALMIWYYLRFNPKGQLALVRTESKIRDIWLAYTRNRIMRQN